MNIEQAIENCDNEIWDIDVESINQHHEIGKWLSELQSYKDKTPITAEWLEKNGFELHEVYCKPDHEFANLCRDKDYYLYCDDVEEISAEIIDNEMGVWRVEVGFLDHGNTESLDICTIGQLIMFLSIEGLESIVKQLK